MDNDYLIKKPPLTGVSFYFSLPMIIGNLFQQTYTMVDSAIVGRYVSEQALAAVGASYALTNIFICVAIGGGIGASVIVSRYFGAKEYGRMKTAVFTALFIFPGYQLSPWRGRSVPWKPDHDLVKHPSGLPGYGGSVSADLFFRTAIPFYV